MGNIAKFNNSVKRILIAGDVVTVGNGDIGIYDAITGNKTSAKVIGFVSIYASNPQLNITIIEQNIGFNITAMKHYNSTNLTDDNAGIYANTWNEDLKDPLSVLIDAELLTDIAGNVFLIEEQFIYTPAVNPPNIPIERLRNVLYSVGNDYNTIFNNAVINNKAPYKPNKIASHGIDELLKYAPKYAPAFFDYSNCIDKTVFIWEGDVAPEKQIEVPYIIDTNQVTKLNNNTITTSSNATGILLFKSSPTNISYVQNGVTHNELGRNWSITYSVKFIILFCNVTNFTSSSFTYTYTMTEKPSIIPAIYLVYEDYFRYTNPNDATDYIIESQLSPNKILLNTGTDVVVNVPYSRGTGPSHPGYIKTYTGTWIYAYRSDNLTKLTNGQYISGEIG